MAGTEILLAARNYDLAATLNSGQVFRWQPECGRPARELPPLLPAGGPPALPDSWIGVLGKHRVRLTQAPESIRAETATPVEDWIWLREFLQTEIDLAEVLKTFPDDQPMQMAVKVCNGLRVLRQDPWECLASFILSSNKQIVHIRQIIALLCERFGEPLTRPSDTLSPSDGERDRVKIPRNNSRVAPLGAPPSRRRVSGTRRRDAGAPGFAGRGAQFTFPTPQTIAATTESELRACKMGFRAPYLLAVARQIADGKFDPDRPRHLPLAEAREELMRLPGVGGKIADCVLLFAYGFNDAFPVDVWVERALRQFYFPRRRVTSKRLRHFTATHFGPYAGYAQQYLFHYMRTKIN